MTHKDPPPIVDGNDSLISSHKHLLALGSDGLVDVHHLHELVKGRKGAKKEPKRTKTDDIELEITPKRAHKYVNMPTERYQPRELAMGNVLMS